MLSACWPLQLLLFCAFISLGIAVYPPSFHNLFELHDSLFCNHPAPQSRQQLLRKNITADCLTAIEAIPKGVATGYHDIAREELDSTGRISLRLDRQRYPLPASFGWGNCLVTVWIDKKNAIRVATNRPDRSRFAAILIYKIWPQAGRAAQETVQRCVNNGYEGEWMSVSRIDDKFVGWGVKVEYFPRKGPRRKEAQQDNVYIAKDAERGKAAFPSTRMQRLGAESKRR